MSIAKKVLLFFTIVALCISYTWWWEERKFDSLLAVLAALTTIITTLFFGNKPIIIPTQIDNTTPDRYPDFTSQMKKVTSLKMIGTNYQSFITRYYNGLTDILKRGGRLKFIGCEPLPHIIEQLTYRSQSSPDIEATKSKIENYIKTLVAMKTGKDYNVELKLLPYISSYGMVQMDMVDGTSVLYVKLYTFKGEGQTPVLVFDSKKEPEWFTFFAKQFQQMWNMTQNEILAKNE